MNIRHDFLEQKLINLAQSLVMNSIIYEPHRRKQARRDLNKTSLKWDAVCAKLKQLKSPSPTKTFWRKNLRIVRVDPSVVLF